MDHAANDHHEATAQPMAHAGHGQPAPHDQHAGHDKHEGHDLGMFQRRFWISLIL
jgi:Cu2+-exporting ATPase